MNPSSLSRGALLLYKNQPARLLQPGEKLEIEIIPTGAVKKVRPKDVDPLHPGPVDSLEPLTPAPEELDEARELLSGEESSLQDLADLLFGEITPASVWSAWQVVIEGLHFQGSPHRVKARTEAEFRAEKERRQARQARRESWQAFLERVAEKALIESDREYLEEVERLAYGEGSESRLLQHLGRQQSKENAHALLIELGWWPENLNPYPRRLGLRLEESDTERLEIPALPSLEETGRRDFTDLAAYAIDDEESHDPDDAISFDGEKLWVHVADVAGLITPGTPLDSYARERAATLYLPETTRTMLPEKLTDTLGLGLQEISPALSFGITIDDHGAIRELEVVPSRIRARRLSYREAEPELEKNPDFQRILALTRAHRERRQRAGSVEIDLPECRIRVKGEEIKITPLKRYRSREMISEAMLIAGAATAIYAEKHNLPMPYAGQAPPGELPEIGDLEPLAAMFATRRAMRPGRITATPQPHAGLGLESYIRTTSPLRRYLDLLAHQQLRRHLAGETPLEEKEILQAIAAVGQTGNRIRQAERLSNRHWTLVYLARHPEWRGEGTVIAEWGRKSLLVIPSLALEWEQNLPGNPLPGTTLELHSPRVNLPWLEVFFRTG